MKKTLAFTFYVAMIGGIIVGTYYEVEALTRITSFLAWGLMILFTLCTFFPPEELFTNLTHERLPMSNMIVRCVMFAYIGTMIAVGWTILAALTLITWIVLWAKRKKWLKGTPVKAEDM